jgi:hypothetical protein
MAELLRAWAGSWGAYCARPEIIMTFETAAYTTMKLYNCSYASLERRVTGPHIAANVAAINYNRFFLQALSKAYYLTSVDHA